MVFTEVSDVHAHTGGCSHASPPNLRPAAASSKASIVGLVGGDRRWLRGPSATMAAEDCNRSRGESRGPERMAEPLHRIYHWDRPAEYPQVRGGGRHGDRDSRGTLLVCTEVPDYERESVGPA